jgi:hypothetical protein
MIDPLIVPAGAQPRKSSEWGEFFVMAALAFPAPKMHVQVLYFCRKQKIRHRSVDVIVSINEHWHAKGLDVQLEKHGNEGMESVEMLSDFVW